MKRTASIDEVLRPLADAPYQAYLSNAVQVADIIEWTLRQIGPADIWQTTFSISEEFIRRLYFIQKANPVKSLTLILDHKATNKTINLWPFLTQVVTASYLADNHSKILLMKGRGRKVSVITSQNLTRGNRAESAFITTDPKIFQDLHDAVQDLVQDHSVPLNELFDQRIQKSLASHFEETEN